MISSPSVSQLTERGRQKQRLHSLHSKSKTTAYIMHNTVDIVALLPGAQNNNSNMETHNEILN